MLAQKETEQTRHGRASKKRDKSIKKKHCLTAHFALLFRAMSLISFYVNAGSLSCNMATQAELRRGQSREMLFVLVQLSEIASPALEERFTY